MKRLISLLIIICIALTLLCSCKTPSKDEPSIVALNFPAYDFAQNIIGDTGSVTLLLPPGGESHTYEPTAKDIIRISSCDVFIYTGGESDYWVEKLVAGLKTKPKLIKMMDFVDVSPQSHDGHTHEIDEHIWTSLKNSVRIIDGICGVLCESYQDKAESFKSNKDSYINKINRLDSDFERLFNTSKRKTIVVADRFPFTYFAEDYGLSYYSAYHSCTEDSEPTPKVIGRLIDCVKEENIPMIFYIEFSNRRIASAVAEDTGVKTAELHSCHSVSKKQLKNGITYLSLMENNYKALKEAVNL